MKPVILVIAAIVVAATVPIRAHHAFGGEFDANRPVLLKGAVVKVEWVNPHAWIHIAVKQPTASREHTSWTTAIGTAVPSPAIPTSGEAIAPTRNEEVPSSAEAEPAACGVRINANALVFGRTMPIADISTNSAALPG